MLLHLSSRERQRLVLGSAPGGWLQIQGLCSPPSLPVILPTLQAQGPSKCFAGLPQAVVLGAWEGSGVAGPVW